jgi:hypothetical protein
VALGAARDFVFINLNYCIDHLANHREENYAHSMVRHATDGLSLRTLVVIKWAFSAAFIATMLGISILSARILFGDHRYRRWLVIGFGMVASIAFILQLGSSVEPALGLVSVKLLHLLQYPVVLFFIWASTWLRPRTG